MKSTPRIFVLPIQRRNNPTMMTCAEQWRSPLSLAKSPVVSRRPAPATPPRRRTGPQRRKGPSIIGIFVSGLAVVLIVLGVHAWSTTRVPKTDLRPAPIPPDAPNSVPISRNTGGAVEMPWIVGKWIWRRRGEVVEFFANGTCTITGDSGMEKEHCSGEWAFQKDGNGILSWKGDHGSWTNTLSLASGGDAIGFGRQRQAPLDLYEARWTWSDGKFAQMTLLLNDFSQWSPKDGPWETRDKKIIGSGDSAGQAGSFHS